MKRILLTFLFLFCFVPLVNAGTSICGGRPAAGGAAEEEEEYYCPTATYAEDWEGSENCLSSSQPYCCTASKWAVVAGSGTVTWNNTPGGTLGCTETDSKNLKMTATTGGNATTVTMDMGSGSGYWQVVVYSRAPGSTSCTDCGLMNIHIAESGGYVIGRVGYYITAGGQLQIYGCAQDTDDAWQCGTYTNVTANAWYPIRITYTKATNLKIEVDLNNDGDFADANEVNLNHSTKIQNFDAQLFLLYFSNYDAFVSEINNLSIKTGSGDATLCTR